MPDWFERNPGQNTALTNSIQRMEKDFVRWGRTQFAANYARGGLSRVAFAPTRKAAVGNAFRSMANDLRYGPSGGEGSRMQKRNLLNMLDDYPDVTSQENIRVQEAYEKVSKQKGSFWKASRWEKTQRVGGRVLGSRIFGPALGLAFAGHAAYAAADQGLGAAGKAFGAEVTGAVAGYGGMYAGAAIGAAAGSVLGPVGMAAGALVGFFGGMMGGYVLGAEAFTGTVELAEGLVDSHRQKRKFNWVGSTAAFDTRRAHTMRQQSLQLMNRGMMTARSTMGREAVMLHQ